jgi:hypothetical protein
VKLLLDNCVVVRAKLLFPEHDVRHVLDEGWETLSNGLLLSAAARGRFEVFVTVDKNIRHQQSLARLPISILELDTVTSRFEALQVLTPYLQRALDATLRFRFVSLRDDGAMETLAPIPG